MVTRIQALVGLQPLGSANLTEWSGALNSSKESLQQMAKKYLRQGYLEISHQGLVPYYALSSKGLELVASQPATNQQSLPEYEGGIVQTAIKRQPISIFHLGAST